MSDDELFKRIAYVSALDVPANAVIVVKSSRRMTVEQAQTLTAQIVERLPGHRVLILSPELDLDVLRETDS